jgi:hypothetical protein
MYTSAEQDMKIYNSHVLLLFYVSVSIERILITLSHINSVGFRSMSEVANVGLSMYDVGEETTTY